MDLSTTYLGFELPHPLMPGASPLADNLDVVRRLEDAGAAAIVLHSLFQEQIEAEQHSVSAATEAHAHSFGEALTYFPDRQLAVGVDAYLERVRRIREAVSIPVIGSLNGTSSAGWLEYGRLIEQAGAHALELNVYYVAANWEESGRAVEQRVLDVVRTVKQGLGIPLAVKLSPYYSSLARLAVELDGAGADGIVLFNRFYQPDIDVEALEVAPRLELSHSFELLPRLRWLAILSGRVRASLAVTGGVHTALDAVKAVMAGAHAVQMVSELLISGPEALRGVRDGLATWLSEHEYDSLRQAQGSMSHQRCPDPAAFERGNYARVLQTWRPASAS
ncbi:MAG: dihydroorotate dehydrogenase-like protein [Thermodesulfobacteriota bacterium]